MDCKDKNKINESQCKRIFNKMDYKSQWSNNSWFTYLFALNSWGFTVYVGW